MDTGDIHLAIPVFFALIGVELLEARLLEHDAYRFGELHRRPLLRHHPAGPRGLPRDGALR
jgi:hypothetical protein